MSSDQPVPEIVPQVAAQPVIEPSGAPPVTDPIIESGPPPEPPPAPEPFWASRRYIKRSFGFPFNGVQVQGSFWRKPDGSIDVDGLYGDIEYQSTDDLVRLAAPTHEDAQVLVTKIREVLARR